MVDKPFNSGGGSGYGSFPEVEGVAGAAAEINRLQDEELKRHVNEVPSWARTSTILDSVTNFFNRSGSFTSPVSAPTQDRILSDIKNRQAASQGGIPLRTSAPSAPSTPNYGSIPTPDPLVGIRNLIDQVDYHRDAMRQMNQDTYWQLTAPLLIKKLRKKNLIK